MKNQLLPLFTLLYLFSLIACNPDCDSLAGVQVKSRFASEGDQIIITANPLSALEGRKVYFNDILAVSSFEPEMGLIATVPEGEGLDGQVELKIEDPDCIDFIPLEFNIAGEAFFQDNPNYVFPLIPEIIIPNLPQDFPPSIENAWLHPLNIDYCIWFTLLSDDTGNCVRIFDPELSFEQSTCYKDNPSYDLLYKENPMTGYIDANDQVFMTIHRPGGEEHFQGRMVSLEDVPTKYHEWTFDAPSDCNPDLPPTSTGPIPERNHMMVLTSQTSGKQLIIYQQAIDQVGPTCM